MHIIKQLLIYTVTNSTIFFIFLYIFRSYLTKKLSASINHKYDKKLEEIKSNIRIQENQKNEIQSFISDLRTNRYNVLQSKKMEAAENLLINLNKISKLSMAAEYLKQLDIENILRTYPQHKLTGITDILLAPLDVDNRLKEINNTNNTFFRLYLNDKSIQYFDTYHSIIIMAITILKSMALGTNLATQINHEKITQEIIKLIPESQDGFNQFGIYYTYQLTSIIYNSLILSLRNEVSGEEDFNNEINRAKQLEFNTTPVSADAASNIYKAGLS